MEGLTSGSSKCNFCLAVTFNYIYLINAVTKLVQRRENEMLIAAFSEIVLI